MNWTLADFLVFLAMLAAAGGALSIMLRSTYSGTYRAAAGLAVAAAFVLVWVNGAVGIIGDEHNDANMLFFGVLAIALVGAFVARFRPRGMARVMLATAIAQVLVAVIALIVAPEPLGPAWPRDLLVLTVFFAAFWLASARLFQVAANRS